MADELGRVETQLGALLDGASRSLSERPYATLGLAALGGYMLGGGLFSSFTRPIVRAALAMLVIPAVREHLRGVVADVAGAQAAGTA